MNQTDPMVSFKQALRTQYGASIEMMRRAIQDCPDEVWDARKGSQNSFWHIAYHTLFYLDLYIGDSDEMHKAFRGQLFHKKNDQLLRQTPSRIFTREELGGYVETVAQKTFGIIENLKPEDLARRTAFPWYDLTVAEMLLNNLRHVAHHVGQLNAILRVETNKAPDWMGKG